MQNTKQFTVFVQGVTLDSDLTLRLPTLDYHMWFFKQGRAVLYFQSLIDITRRLFHTTHRGHSALTDKGFTIQSSKSGPKAENYIRKILKEGGW